MRILLYILTGLFAAQAAHIVTANSNDTAPFWRADQIIELQKLVAEARDEGLDNCRFTNIDDLADEAPSLMRSTLASAVATQLMRAHLNGCSHPSKRQAWHINSHDDVINVDGLLRQALQRDDLRNFVGAMKPRHPQYDNLVKAYRFEKDPEKRAILAFNLERWRWMPLVMGDTYLLVNVPQYEVGLWENGQELGRWRVIVGKRRTPTPVFTAQVSGVVLNPWWNIPASIVRESVGALVRNRPAEARRRGYIVKNGRYRQKPGPGNALGQMKLIMPNPYSVFLHDTSNRSLFEEEVRTFSHGCIRVGNAIDFAETLLKGAMGRTEIDRVLASRKNTRVAMTTPISLYVTYFTAMADKEGRAQYFEDIYRRDQIDNKLAAKRVPDENCPA